MDEFNIGDKVNAKNKTYLGEKVGVVVGIDTREDIPEDNFGKYLVKFNSLSMYEGWAYNIFCKNPRYIIEPYNGYAIWLDDLEKVEDKCEEECKKDKHEEDIRMEFAKIREQKKEIVEGMSEKVLQLTSEIKEIECEMKKIIKEWHLD